MTTRDIDPEDGSLVEREGVNAGSAAGTVEGAGQAPPPDAVLTGGSTTGRPADREPQDDTESGGLVSEPAQVWADETGGGPDHESGQDVGSIA
jgi:hypothetical protein